MSLTWPCASERRGSPSSSNSGLNSFLPARMKNARRGAGDEKYCPNRAGFIERLGQYFSSPAPRRAFFILAGKKLFKPLFELLGDPLRSDAQGHVSDIPFAVYWLELLARLGLARQIPSANRVLARLYSECDDQGIWSPNGLRAMPKATNPVTAHYFPLEGPGKSPAQRQTDVTFRLALIARLMGIPVEVA